MSYSVQATNTTFSSTVDGGVRIAFITQELTDEEKMIIMKHHREFGTLVFSSHGKDKDDN